MMFDELNKICVAVWATELRFDYFGRTVLMIVKPNYGFDNNIKDKLFQLTFTECMYVCSSNISRLAEDGYTEFISWGKSQKDCCKNNSCKLLDSFLSRTISAGFTSFGFNQTNTGHYGHYYFENALGDAIDIICSSAKVIEI
jgi:hypothetical protein